MVYPEFLRFDISVYFVVDHINIPYHTTTT